MLKNLDLVRPLKEFWGVVTSKKLLLVAWDSLDRVDLCTWSRLLLQTQWTNIPQSCFAIVKQCFFKFLVRLLQSFKVCVPYVATQFVVLIGHSVIQCWFLFCGSLEYNSQILEKLHREIHIWIEHPTSHCSILRVHIVK